MDERVVLVDERDRELGTKEKRAAHEAGLLHRAFSVFILDGRARVLLQRRALGKYHSAGLWSNTCCGHPRPGEPVVVAAGRRLQEEMGFTCALVPAGAFVYRAPIGQLVEHEYDHVFVGRFDGPPHPDATEVLEWRWVAVPELERELDLHPERYTTWLRMALDLSALGKPDARPATRPPGPEP